MNKNQSEQPKRLGALSLLKKIFAGQNAELKDFGDGRYVFSYCYDGENSETLVIEADDEHVKVKMVDYFWYEVSKWDIEEVSRIQSLINNYNANGSGKVVYTYEDDDMMKLTSIVIFPLYEDIPNIEAYFDAMVEGLIHSHQCIAEVIDGNEATDDAEATDDNEAADNSIEKGGEA